MEEKMKTHALQELVKKIFGDEKTKQEFEKDPDSVLAHWLGAIGGNSRC
jgi:hypothetical protein